MKQQGCLCMAVGTGKISIDRTTMFTIVDMPVFQLVNKLLQQS